MNNLPHNDDNYEEFPVWWKAPWDAFVAQRQAGRLPHAQLITGRPGLGKDRFAHEIAKSLICESPVSDGRACGTCKACLLVASGNHPDLMTLHPEEEGKAILIDQIRDLSTRLTLKSHSGAYKVAVISPAGKMNPHAADSLLKTLEEPTDNTILLLVSEHAARLSATIRSRCQGIRLEPPGLGDGLQWLEAHGVTENREELLEMATGSPLLAKTYADNNVLSLHSERWSQLEQLTRGAADPVEVAQEWAENDITRNLYWFSTWLMDMIRLKFSPAPPLLGNKNFVSSFNAINETLDSQTLFGLLERNIEAQRLLSTSVNKRLLCEEQLIAWTTATTTVPRKHQTRQ